MARRSKGFRSKTRRTLKIRGRFRRPITKSLEEFGIGSRVTIRQDPSLQKGMPHPRFQGKAGVVKEIRGRSYLVEVKDGGKTKTLVSRPEHMKALK